MRVLIGPDTTDLAELYAAPSAPWLRVNMVSTVDGAATGEDGRSGGINNAVDRDVFHTLRRLADAIVVGAGTARAEGYRPTDRPTVVVSRSGRVPPNLRGADAGVVLLVTCSAGAGIDEARALLGDDHVLVAGGHRVDLGSMKAQLVERGLVQLLSEGGPHLLRDLLDQGVADELCCTVVPRAIAGEHPRITDGPPVDVPLELHTLLEEDGTLLGRWLTPGG